ncbi:hypothetical protein MKZ38_010233 [Zalerion maritima]|uniref:Uncharacterized protein n=1 Tax=Zalerion maritima TaxID=339359 RepID=A0AAD5WSK3_9PEZI|nr:hypothetical protein MKZ38_010233 [Zalerion maritima]
MDPQPESEVTFPSSTDNNTGNEKLSSATLPSFAVLPPPWCPAWLGKKVFLGFAFLFIALMTSVITLGVYSSNSPDGLGRADQDVHYAWRLGPTAVLVLVSAVWTRVELQGLLFTPWIALRAAKKQEDVQSLVRLDYLSKNQISALFHSWLQGHYFATIILVVGLLLKVLLILSSSLIYSETTDITTTLQIQHSDVFVFPGPTDGQGTWIDLNESDTRPFYDVLGTHRQNATYPTGTSKTFAYQLFGPSEADEEADQLLPPTLGTTSDSRLISQVSTFSMAAECELPSVWEEEFLDDRQVWNLTYGFSSCDQLYNWTIPAADTVPEEGEEFATRVALLFYDENSKYASEKCMPAGLGESRMMVGAGRINTRRNPDNRDQIQMITVPLGVAFCQLKMKRQAREVVQYFNGTTAVESVDGDEGELEETAMDAMNVILASVPYTAEWGSRSIMQALSVFSGGFEFTPEADFSLDQKHDGLHEGMAKVVNDFITDIGAFVGHYRLRHPEVSDQVGGLVVPVECVWINNSTMIAFVAILGILLACSALLWSPIGKNLVWSQNPTTSMGFAATQRFINYHQLCTVSKDTQPSWHRKSGELGDPKFHSPWPLKKTYRLLGSAYLVVLIAILGVLHTLSHRPNGIGWLGSSVGISDKYLWTTIPALLAFLASTYATASNFEIRRLAPLVLPMGGKVSSTALTYTSLDRFGPMVLYDSMRIRQWMVFFSEAVAVLAGTLTIVASLLFEEQPFPSETGVQMVQTTRWGWPNDTSTYITDLQPDTWYFNSLLGAKGLDGIMSLNSWPQGTYGNIAFPNLEVPGSVMKDGNSMKAKVPGFVRETNCERDLSDFVQIPAQVGAEELFLLNTTGPWGDMTWTDQSYEEFDDGLVKLQVLPSENQTEVVYFVGEVRGDKQKKYDGDTVGTLLVYWGSVQNGSFLFTTAWRCYTSSMEADYDVVFEGAGMRISKAPIPHPETRKVSQFIPPGTELDFVTLSTGLYDQNSTLPLPPLVGENGTASTTMYGSPVFEEDIIQGWAVLSSLLDTQTVIRGNRIPVEEGFVDYSSGETVPPEMDLPPINGTLIDPSAYRLVQKTWPTAIFLSFLGTILLFSLFSFLAPLLRLTGMRPRGWMLDVDKLKGLAYRNPSSIESMHELLRESNIAAILPPGADNMRPQELHEALVGWEFRLGWWRKRSGDGWKDVYTVAVLGMGMEFLGTGKAAKMPREREEGASVESLGTSASSVGKSGSSRDVVRIASFGSNPVGPLSESSGSIRR